MSYLAHYAPGVARYSADGHRLTGTAYGPRIFRHGSSALDQWSAVVDLLRADPDSKRAVIQVFRPDELDAPDNRDVACTLALQFLIREERLHTIGYMRANDAYRGMVSDVFSFTFLQEMMARQLGVALGPYTHVAGSLHLDRPDLERARRLVGAGPAQGLPPDVMPPMPDGDNWSSLWRVMTIEEALRADDLRLDATTLDGLDLPEYWEHVLVLFELHRRERYGTGEADGLAGRLPRCTGNCCSPASRTWQPTVPR